MHIYRDPIKIPVVLDVSQLSLEQRDEFLSQSFMKDVKLLTHPHQLTPMIADRMSKKGYPVFTKMPATLNSDTVEHLYVNSLLEYNQWAKLSRKPNIVGLNRNISSLSDTSAIVETLTLQQDDIALSALYRTFDINAAGGVVYSTSKTPINGKIALTVISVEGIDESDDEEKPKRGRKKGGIETVEQNPWIKYDIEIKNAISAYEVFKKEQFEKRYK